jgi:hypothetical protein
MVVRPEHVADNLNKIVNNGFPLDGGSACRKAATYTQDNTNTE